MRAKPGTFSFIFALSARSEGERRHRRKSQGFTLIEMMVVVIIITLIASIALPSVARQMQSHRTKQAAETIASIYRGARLRSLGRGSAVLVRYTASTGTFALREAIQGEDASGAGCAQLPEASCLEPSNRWGDTDRYQPLKSVDFRTSGDIVLSPTVMVPGADADGAIETAATNLDFCFSPSGRSYYRTDLTSSTFTPVTWPTVFEVSRTDGVGFPRAVVITPNGNARTVASE